MADAGRLSADAAPFLILRSIENTLVNSYKLPPDPATSLARKKRPPMLQIPAVAPGNPLAPGSRSPPSGTTPAAGVSAAGPGWGVFSRKGRRKSNLEDFYTALPRPESYPSYKGFFGVYDGHGGRSAGKYVAAKLHENVLEMLAECEGSDGDGGVSKEDAIREGFLKTDQEFLKKKVGSGACCVTAVIEEEGIAVSNVGDCRAVLSRGGIADALTKDHKGSRPDEKARVEAKGGFMMCKQGIWRVQGDLAITRSVGDAHLKEWGVTAEPDTMVLPVTPEMDFLILASDGLWDKVGNQEAVDTVTQFRLLNATLDKKQDETTKKRKREAKEEDAAEKNKALSCSNNDNDSKNEQCGGGSGEKSSSSSSFSNLEILTDKQLDKKASCSLLNTMDAEKEDKKDGQHGTAKTVEITGDGDKRNGGKGSTNSCPLEMSEIETDNEPVRSQDTDVDKPSVVESATFPSEMVEKATGSPSGRMKVASEEDRHPILNSGRSKDDVRQREGDQSGSSPVTAVEKAICDKDEQNGSGEYTSSCPSESETRSISNGNRKIPCEGSNGDHHTPSGKENSSSLSDRRMEITSGNHPYPDENASPPRKKTRLANEPVATRDPNGDHQQASGNKGTDYSLSCTSGEIGREYYRYSDENASPSQRKKMEMARATGSVTPSKGIERHRRVGTPTPTPTQKHRSLWAAASEKLAGVALRKGSNDDITVMIIDLKHYQ